MPLLKSLGSKTMSHRDNNLNQSAKEQLRFLKIKGFKIGLERYLI